MKLTIELKIGTYAKYSNKYLTIIKNPILKPYR